MTDQPSTESTERPERAIRITGTIAAVLAVITLGLGIGAGLIARERRNEDPRPRTIVMYGINPDASVRYVDLVFAADLSLTDDDIPFEPETVTVTGPPVESLDSIRDVTIIGAELTDQSVTETDLDNLIPVYTMFRPEPNDYRYGVDMAVDDLPVVTQAGDQITLELAVGPQETFVQRMFAVVVPRDAQIDLIEGPGQYRDTRAGEWHVYYFDVTLIDANEVIRVVLTPPVGTPDPFNRQTVDRGR